MPGKQVFHDVTERRKRAVFYITIGLIFASIVLLACFAISIVTVPYSLGPKTNLANHIVRRDYQVKKKILEKHIAQERTHQKVRPAVTAGSKSQVIAFYSPDQENGLFSLRANASKMTALMPAWLHLNESGDGLSYIDWDTALNPKNLEVLDVARQAGLGIYPIFNNAAEGLFDPVRAGKMLTDPSNGRKVADALVTWLKDNSFQGLNLDLENLNQKDYSLLPAFVSYLQEQLKKNGLGLSIDLEAENKLVPLVRLAELSDFIVLMTYDEHETESAPGAIASYDWVNREIQKALVKIPASKIVMGIGAYAYDWNLASKKAESITYQGAIILARDNRPDEKPEDVIDFDEKTLNPNFEYDDDSNQPHRVWFLDATSAYNQWQIVKRERLGGAAVWVLGSEDPDVWKAFGDGPHEKIAQLLSQSVYPYDVEYEGDGEILSLASQPTSGSRTISIDSDTGLIDEVSYQAYPSSFVIKRSGFKPNTIVLTFDDGPSVKYTPQIIAKLRQYQLPAAFFVLGENAEQYPDLIQDLWDGGFEIGNHTYSHPDLSAVSEERVRLELNTTQRLLESITNHSTKLFRAPYNADAEPTDIDEIKPIVQSTKLGYMTVGELIDPQDWNLFKVENGVRVGRTVDDLVSSTLDQLQTTKGNIVLLHDGGGDRSRTVELLDKLVPRLQQEGYQFSSIAGLIGKTRADLMPALSNPQGMLVGSDRIAFLIVNWGGRILRWVFISSIFLGIGRVLLMSALALIERLRTEKRCYPEGFRPFVSVLVPAFNEEKVCVATIDSLLKSRYPSFEIIAIDDGSTDQTCARIQEHFGNNQKVRLITKPNGGKASALNAGIGLAAGEILVTVDADTQIAPDAIDLLVRHFADEKVGAVAGNVKVGNRVNLLTIWQSIEYISSQNLERRAYGLLNAITVVPGAIGAWRKSAVESAGNFRGNTLAEDMDLTWQLRIHGWRTETESEAIAYTEVPTTVGRFFAQRFRWTYGTLQCLWIHRRATMRHGWFGRLALPSMWLFGIVFQMMAPLIDLITLYALGAFFVAFLNRHEFTHDWQPYDIAQINLIRIGIYYALFIGVEFSGALLAFVLDDEKLKDLRYQILQRFCYRQIMYAVIWKSLITAIRGLRKDWGTMERTATVGD